MSESKSTYERVARNRAKLPETGGRRVDLRLTPAANAAADRLLEEGVASNLTALINQLLVERDDQGSP